ncbi:serine threonine- kinase N2 isoform X2 [Pelobates cultripes]|uniref:Serine threonine- kinase N2 isoform X2 n=1 Tax=Pelobates cultripes TaxID=61616 RepID=A0AAD1S4Q1_PELCU|nr:serine threonine- kinase N2 isoform X2 [Pelobates cultripes]
MEDIKIGRETLIEAGKSRERQRKCSKTPDSPKTNNGSSTSDGFSSIHLNTPTDHLVQPDIDEIKKQIIEDITKENKIIEGAIKIRNVASDKKHLSNVDQFLQTSQHKLHELYNKLQEHNAPTMQEAKEISDAPKADISSQADNEKLTALQKQLETELKVKHGAETMIQAYSKDLSKNITYIVAVQKTLHESEKKIDSLRILILQEKPIVREETLLPAPEADNDIVAAPTVLTDQEIQAQRTECQISKEAEQKAEELPEETLLPAPEADNDTVAATPIVTDQEILAQCTERQISEEAEQKAEELPEETLLSAPETDNDTVAATPIVKDQEILAQDSGATSDPGVQVSTPETSADLCIPPRIPLSLQDFKLYSVLGRGNFGKVLLAEYKDTKNMYALKVLKIQQIVSSNKIHRLIGEKNVFQAVSNRRHPFLVNLFGCFHNEHYACFAMEYAAGGDLLTNLNNNQEPFSEPRAMFYAACVVLGLEFLHEQKIVHRDLKTENIVIDQEGFAKITDFGLVKQGMGFGDRTSSFCGTRDYAAPEVLLYKPYTKAVDWWSLGVVIYLLLTGDFPFESDDSWELSAKIIESKVTFPKSLSRKAKSLIRKLLTKKEKARLGASKKDAKEVKRHSFFKGGCSSAAALLASAGGSACRTSLSGVLGYQALHVY